MPDADVIIIGGGTSGLAAAAAAAKKGDSVLLLERFERPGKKLLATGNGRCNLMNRNSPVYYGDTVFARKVLGSGYLDELTAFWNHIGIPIRYERDGRGYPGTFQAVSVWEALLAESRRRGVSIHTRTPVTDLYKHNGVFHVLTESGTHYTCYRSVLSTGGLAQKKLGGSCDAWPWLEKMGHHMIGPFPALSSLKAEKRAVSGLAGIKVKCQLSLWADGSELHTEKGELLFTENGISGICVMQCARFVHNRNCECRINLVSDLFHCKDDLVAELNYRKIRFPDESPVELLRGFCLPKLAFAVCKQSGLSLRDEINHHLTESQLDMIAEHMMNYRVPILETDGFDKAQVMAGGLCGNEIDPENMESLLIPGLHVTGELLNVDGDCGGYNLMFAVMSGLKAGWNRRT